MKTFMQYIREKQEMSDEMVEVFKRDSRTGRKYIKGKLRRPGQGRLNRQGISPDSLRYIRKKDQFDSKSLTGHYQDDVNEDHSKMSEELQKRLIRLQDEQREAEDAGNMEKADRLHQQIEKLYNNMNRWGVDASGPGWQ